MQEHDSEQTQAPVQTPEAVPEETPETVAGGTDTQVADAVEQRAAQLTGAEGEAVLQAPQAGSDPIAQAEAHLETLDMDEERRKVAELQKTL